MDEDYIYPHKLNGLVTEKYLFKNDLTNLFEQIGINVSNFKKEISLHNYVQIELMSVKEVMSLFSINKNNAVSAMYKFLFFKLTGMSRNRLLYNSKSTLLNLVLFERFRISKVIYKCAIMTLTNKGDIGNFIAEDGDDLVHPHIYDHCCFNEFSLSIANAIRTKGLLGYISEINLFLNTFYRRGAYAWGRQLPYLEINYIEEMSNIISLNNYLSKNNLTMPYEIFKNSYKHSNHISEINILDIIKNQLGVDLCNHRLLGRIEHFYTTEMTDEIRDISKMIDLIPRTLFDYHDCYDNYFSRLERFKFNRMFFMSILLSTLNKKELLYLGKFSNEEVDWKENTTVNIPIRCIKVNGIKTIENIETKIQNGLPLLQKTHTYIKDKVTKKANRQLENMIDTKEVIEKWLNSSL